MKSGRTATPRRARLPGRSTLVATGTAAFGMAGSSNSASGPTKDKTGLGRSFLGYTAARLASGMLGFVSIPLWLHGIGPAEYAVFSLVLGFTSVATSIAGGWLRQAAVRNAGNASGALGLLPRWPIALAVLLPTVPLTGWLYISFPELCASTSSGLPFAAILFCVAMGLFGVVSVRVQRDNQAGLFAVGEATRTSVGLVAWLLAAHLVGAKGAVSVLISSALGALCGAAVLAGRNPFSLARRTTTGDYDLLRSYWRYGWPMSLWLALSSALIYVDRFVVNAILGPASAGRYAAVADIVVRGITMLAFPVTMAMHPIVMAEWNAGRFDRARAILKSAARAFQVALAACVLAMMLAGPPLFRMALPGVTASTGLLVSLTVGAAMWQCALLAHKPLEIAGRTRLMLGILALAGATTGVLDAVLVRCIGAEGAAVGFALGASCYTITCLSIGPAVLRQCLPGVRQ